MFAAPPSPSHSSDHLLPGVSGAEMASGASQHWPLVIQLANCIVGVSVLAMPFVMSQCGLVLGAAVVLASGWLTGVTCSLLIRAGHSARRRSYEQLALSAYGPIGKLAIEIVIITFLMSTLCAFLVVIGDLAPTVLYMERLGRAPAMALVALLVILPLSLLRDMSSLNTLCSLSILFYCAFVLRLFALAVPLIIDGDWMHEVRLFRTAGLWRSVPIVALALSCQTQIFQLARCIADSDSALPQPHVIDSVVGRAVALCQVMYCSVGALGYVAFHRSASADGSVAGDVLLLLPAHSPASTALIRLGFLLSVAVSFPLMLFPCRAALHHMLWHTRHGTGGSMELDSADPHSIPDGPFTLLTAGIIAFVLFTALYIPNVEFVLGLSGSLVGSIVCIVAPAALFIKLAAGTQHRLAMRARVSLAVGCFMLVVCTYATLSAEPADGHSDGPMGPPAADADALLPPPQVPNAAATGANRSAAGDFAKPQAAQEAVLDNGPGRKSAESRPDNVGERREPPVPVQADDHNKPEQKRSADGANAASQIERDKLEQPQVPPAAAADQAAVQPALEPGEAGRGSGPVGRQPVRADQHAGGQRGRGTVQPAVSTTTLVDAKKLLAELQRQREVQHDLVQGQRLILDKLRQQQMQQQQPEEEERAEGAAVPPADAAAPLDKVTAAPAGREPDRGRLDNQKPEAAAAEHKANEQKNEP